MSPKDEVVLGEGMKPFLAYGWQPQVMAVEGRFKVIQAGTREVYDVVADPAETRDLAATRGAVAAAAHGARRVPDPVARAATGLRGARARRSAASSRASAT